MNAAGELLHKQGQLSEAKVLLDRALVGCIKVLGVDDVATCAGQDNPPPPHPYPHSHTHTHVHAATLL